jgi:PhoH-like ATPase
MADKRPKNGSLKNAAHDAPKHPNANGDGSAGRHDNATSSHSTPPSLGGRLSRYVDLHENDHHPDASRNGHDPKGVSSHGERMTNTTHGSHDRPVTQPGQHVPQGRISKNDLARITSTGPANDAHAHARAIAMATSSHPTPTPGDVERSAGAARPIADRAPSVTSDDDVGIKTFVIDTNVLLHNPDALFVFKEHHVVIPFMVIEELDKMKRKDDDLGRNARACIRHLDRLRQIGKLGDGVDWGLLQLQPNTARSTGPNGSTGTIRIDMVDYERPGAIAEDMPDNHIIAVAWHLKQTGTNVVFVTKDLSARIKSDALGIRTEDFANQKVDADKLYTGYMTAEVDGALIDELYRDRLLPLARIEEVLMEQGQDGQMYARALFPNQYVVLKNKDDENHTGLARRLADTDHVIPITGPRKAVYGIIARNVQQTMALDALLDEEIKLITLLGSAGTGKTLVALAAGMAKVFSEERYEKLLVARPIMPLGRDIGYLPGDKDEKLTAWMQPIFDNLSYLLSTRGGGSQHAESISSEQRITKLMADGKLVLEPLTYIRGRSIPHQFMIVDEAQNLTPHEVKTIASRVGEGTKLILTGDIGQIDNPYLDSSSNGLAYTIEKMKGVRLYAHVTLAKSERSELASLAASRL